MHLLGLTYNSHDAAAAIVRDGLVIAACEEERFNRERSTKQFPAQAIAACCNIAGISFNDIDRIAFFLKPYLHFKLGLYNLVAGFPKSLLYLPYVLELALKRYKVKELLSTEIQRHAVSVDFVHHHVAHAASAFYTSPFESAAILTIDGRGEYESICIFHGKGTKIAKKYSVKFPNSIGYLYSAITKFLGFQPLKDEYKVMGLAAYGTPKLCESFSEIVGLTDSGFKINLNYFDHHFRYGNRRNRYSTKFIDRFGKPRASGEPITQEHADLSFALQRVTELIIATFLRRAKEITREKKLCLSGGVALNCVANSKILEEGLFDEVFIHPAANDAGTAVGAALFDYYSLFPQKIRHPLPSIYLGTDCQEDDIINSEENNDKVKITHIGDPAAVGARLIDKGCVIGWFQGRMEFGPRALGNRSIIAAPRDKSMIARINKIKHREDFRPFAPAVLAECVDRYFDCNTAGKHLYPFMLSTVPVREEVIHKISAVVHVDGTARVQIVHKEYNSLFWQLIKEYQKLSGIPLVLNTSFNIKGEPIVSSVEQALKSFLDSDLDYLIIAEYLVEKRETPRNVQNLQRIDSSFSRMSSNKGCLHI